MTTLSYQARRGQLQTYFDRTAVDAWARLTSDAPVGSIRATVRAGRTEMRNTLLPKLVGLACERAPSDLGHGSIDFRVGDLLDPSLGRFDFAVAMDSLIHYEARDMSRVVTGLAQRTSSSVLFTFAPRTALLGFMHSVGKLFPRSDRAPAIEPVAEARIVKLLGSEPGLELWQRGRTKRIASGFYISQALELSSL
jgi:magnesium-protoporphyrin O-methyltransferase